MSDIKESTKDAQPPADGPKVEGNNTAASVEDVPDPDEDDLDDLDDMLDEFSHTKIDPKKSDPAIQAAAAASSTPAPPVPGFGAAAGDQDKTLEDILGDEDFAKQLQAGMADLLGELDKNPDMQKEFDNMFKSMSAAAEQPTPGDAASSAQQPSASTTDDKSAGAAGEASFQDTIRRTMERMQASGDQATAAAAESSPDDLLAEMMKQFGPGGDGLGEGSDEDFSKMLMGMMEQLTNKEILYEPMKELDEKFPEWLEKNREKTKPEELKQYEQQQVIVREIVAKFDEKTYADSNAADREYIVNRMQKMQDLGSPPPDLVGDMPSAQDAFGAADMESCNPQ